MRALRNILMCLFASLAIVNAAGKYYEEISATDGTTIIEYPLQRTPIIHKSFHKCSISKYCTYVIKNLASGKFSLCNSRADLPHNTTGLRIWKKIDHGPSHNCQEAYLKGYHTTGALPIYVPGMDIINIRCDMVTAGGGWIVFQRRVDASVDFYRGWEDYKNGFGDLNGNFWLGLEKIHRLASPGKGAILRVDMKQLNYSNTVKYAEYRKFEILSESEGYMLKVGNFSGNTGDSLAYHNGCKFITKDRDAEGGCSQTFTGAWWYSSCFSSNLNGLYPAGGQDNIKCIAWDSLTKANGPIIFSEMKFRYSFL